MTKQLRRGMGWTLAVALVAAFVACGEEEKAASVSGVALSDGPIAGQVSLNDSSPQEQQRTAMTGADGSFTFEVTGLTPPYEVAVEWDAGGSPGKLFAVTEGNGSLDVNPLTDTVFAAASCRDGADDDERSRTEERMETARRARNILVQLQTVLAPLFERYGITDPTTDRAAVRALLEDVRIRRDDGTVTVTNRATGAVIFRGSLSDLSAGTFYPENMPAGPGTPPPAETCSAFTYSAWGECQADGTQTRTVLTSSPAGCTGGSPVVSQACTYVPPVTTCSAFTYSAWGACQADNTQSRTVLTSSPAGCTGGSPVVSRACTYVPPVTTCSAFTYSAWGACQADNTQTRTVLTSSPAGCTGGSPVVSQSCTYVPPVTTCSAFTYSAWGTCQSNNTQTRTVLTSSPAGCTGGSPVVTQACTYVPPVTTCSAFTYSAWGACQSNNTQTRTVLTSSPAGCTGGSPVVSQSCTYVPPVTTCSAFTYSAWGACQSNNTQTRTVLTSSPAGCTGGSPVVTQACTYTPPVCTYTYSEWSACSTSGTQTRTVVSSSPSGCAGTPVLSQACTPPPPPPSCTTCHAIPPATGRHSLHTSFATCATCHGTGYSTTTANAATHLNGVKDLTTTIGWNSSTRTCTNACHGSKSW